MPFFFKNVESCENAAVYYCKKDDFALYRSHGDTPSFIVHFLKFLSLDNVFILIDRSIKKNGLVKIIKIDPLID